MAAKSAVRSRPKAAQGKAASAEDTASLKAQIAQLQAQLGARGPDPNAEPPAEYPKVKYHKHAITPRWRNGYIARQVSLEEEGRLGPGWVDSPDDV